MEAVVMTGNDVKKLEKEYVTFMNLERMPFYILEAKKVSLSKAENSGFLKYIPVFFLNILEFIVEFIISYVLYFYPN